MKYSWFLLLGACSFFIDRFDKDLLEQKGIQTKSPEKQTYCEIVKKYSLVAENKNTIELYENFMKNISKRFTLKFIDRSILWSLVQMNARPDLSSPTAKLQIFLSYQKKDYFYNAYSSLNRGYPQFFLMEKLLKDFNSRFSLLDLIRIYDSFFPAQLTVSKNFESFLNINQLALKKNLVLNDFYIRGDESLKEGESLPKVSFKKLYRNYKKTNKKSYEVTNFLFESKQGPQLKSYCNFETSLYKSSIFLINDELLSSHTYGLKSGQNMYFATSSQANILIEPVNDSPFFRGNSNSRSAAMCRLENSQTDTEMWFISSKSRDPGQHIYHLVEYGLEEIQDIKSLDTMVKFSRHQFLKNPVRLVIESKRSSEKQIDELLKLNIPIYNSKKLGQIWGFFKNRGKSTFLIDDRREGHIQCRSN